MSSDTVKCVRSATLRVMEGDLRACIEILSLQGQVYGFEEMITLLAQGVARAMETYCDAHDVSAGEMLQRLGLELAGSAGTSGTRDMVVIATAALAHEETLLTTLASELDNPALTSAALATLFARTCEWSRCGDDNLGAVVDEFLGT